MSAGKYIIRSVKYFFAFVVLYLTLVFLSTEFSGSMVSMWDSIAITLQSQRGWLLSGAVVVLSALYPLFGYTTRRVECYMEEDMERIEVAFKMSGFELVRREEDKLIYRADNVVRRTLLLYEDEVEVSQYAQWVEIKGMRRIVARVAYRLDGYMLNKNRE